MVQTGSACDPADAAACYDACCVTMTTHAVEFKNDPSEMRRLGRARVFRVGSFLNSSELVEEEVTNKRRGLIQRAR